MLPPRTQREPSRGAAQQGVEADEAKRIGASQLNSSVLRTAAYAIQSRLE
jgi:hypothetical protein